MLDTEPIRHRPLGRDARDARDAFDPGVARDALDTPGTSGHSLADARVRSLAARPVGAVKVRRPQHQPIRHR